jgi:hypothetical protein
VASANQVKRDNTPKPDAFKSVHNQVDAKKEKQEQAKKEKMLAEQAAATQAALKEPSEEEKLEQAVREQKTAVIHKFKQIDLQAI